MKSNDINDVGDAASAETVDAEPKAVERRQVDCTQHAKLGDVVAVKGTVVGVDENSVTIEISDNDGFHTSRITINNTQVSDAIL